MIIDFLLDAPIWIAVALVLAFWAWKMVRYRGFRAAMFGAAIDRSLGEVKGERSVLHSITVKIHRLSGASEQKAVGLELVSKVQRRGELPNASGYPVRSGGQRPFRLASCRRRK
jgi:hypothetical protein